MTVTTHGAGVLDAAAVTVFRAGLGRPVPYGYIRIGPGIAIPAVLRDFDVAIEPLLWRVGIPA
ncbi:MAG: hypothetical protein ACRED3_20190, partial [Bradyrhizobium sp.]